MLRAKEVKMGENGQNDNTKYNEHIETGTSSSTTTNNQQQTQSQQQQQQQQPRQQTTTNRFADYFVICGLDLDTGLEPDRFAGMYLAQTINNCNYTSITLEIYLYIYTDKYEYFFQ